MFAIDRNIQLNAAMAQSAGDAATRAGSDEASLRKAAQQFEGLLTQQMLKTMRATSFGDDLTGAQGGQWMDLYDREMAQHLASSGKGIGIAEMMVRQLGGSAAEEGTQAVAKFMPIDPSRVAPRAPAATQVAAARAAYGAPLGAEVDALSSAAPAVDAAERGDTRGWRPRSPREFVERLQPYAEKAAAQLGVPARALVAQAALETGWGRHLPRHADGQSSFNLFGIKAQRSWDGASVNHATREFRNGAMQAERADFRAYDSIEASFSDYVRFLKANPRYQDALRAGSDGVHSFAQGLQKAGYATDPAYAQKIARVAFGRSMNAAWDVGGSPRVA